MQNTEFFKGKRALVVGGSGGIGRALASALSASGSIVTVVAGHEGTRAASVRKNVDSVVVLDFESLNLAEFDSPCENLSENSDSPLKKLKHSITIADILCICYGPFLQKSLGQTSAKDWLRMTTDNLALPGILSSKAIPFMEERGFGRILFFGGTRTHNINGFATNAAYAAAKTGLSSLVKSIAMQYRDCGIKASAIMPGFVETEYVDAGKKAEYERLLGGKMIRVESVVQKALFLLSSPDMNGVLLNVDDGWNV